MQTNLEITVYRIVTLGIAENSTENLGIFVGYTVKKSEIAY
jgi:hypothetical protein